ncbi:hypothetical protein Tco_0724482 [Tanacetum coccineum]
MKTPLSSLSILLISSGEICILYSSYAIEPARVKELSNRICLVHGFERVCVVMSPFLDQWKNTSVGAKDAGFEREKQANEGS